MCVFACVCVWQWVAVVFSVMSLENVICVGKFFQTSAFLYHCYEKKLLHLLFTTFNRYSGLHPRHHQPLTVYQRLRLQHAPWWRPGELCECNVWMWVWVYVFVYMYQVILQQVLDGQVKILETDISGRNATTKDWLVRHLNRWIIYIGSQRNIFPSRTSAWPHAALL